MKNQREETAYMDLYMHNQKGFILMENSANALLLQFKEPLIYDLTIPSFYNIKTLMHILIDDINGIKVDPRRVDCLTGSDYPSVIHFDFHETFSEKVEKGLGFCFITYSKYDYAPLEVYLDMGDIFGREKNFYRFRVGKRGETQKKVERYFDKQELESFDKIGEFIKPYVSRLNLPHKCAVY